MKSQMFIITILGLCGVFVLAKGGILCVATAELVPQVRGGQDCTGSDEHHGIPCDTLPNFDPCNSTYREAEAIEGQVLDFLKKTANQCLADGCKNVTVDIKDTDPATNSCEDVTPPPADPGM